MTWSAGRKLSHLAAEKGSVWDLAAGVVGLGFVNERTAAGWHEGATFGLRVGGKPKLVVAFAGYQRKKKAGNGDEALAAKVSGVETGGVEFEHHSEVPKQCFSREKWL